MHRCEYIATCINNLLLTELAGVYTNCLFVTLNSREYIRTGNTTNESIALGMISGPYAINTVRIGTNYPNIEP